MRKAWNALDVTGTRYSRLIALFKVATDSNSKRNNRVSIWRCECDCGNFVDVPVSLLRNGNTKSCGCYKLEKLIDRSVTHGMSKSRLYKTWSDMKARCYNHKNKRYNAYGERGIEVCPEWRHGFDIFAEWATANGYDDTLTIDRIDVNKDYFPENCRFIPHIEQARNRNFNRPITINGETKIIADWAREAGINYHTMIGRVNSGWSGADLIKPLQNGGGCSA